MLSNLIFVPTVIALLISTASSATIAQVLATDSNLVMQADVLDKSVVAIIATTPTATKQQVPTKLQTLNLAIVSAKNSLTPTAPTSDPPTESEVVRSFDLFSNTIEELAADYYHVKPYLSPVANLQKDTYNQLGYLNTNFQTYLNFIVGIVGDQATKTVITTNAQVTTGQITNVTNYYA